jgi:ABC-type polysaccharide/polyol phosphate transport system ATPase subunit
MKKEIAIKLTGVTKKYYVHHDKPTLAERILRGKDEEFFALKNISLTVNKGERVGIIGANGSGKTTLLKLITGISTPTKGKVETYGKIVSLIDLEAGFHPDLTGIQNIYLNGTLLGLSKKEIDRKLQNIISFADIGKFIDASLFTYSSGMVLRLAFSIAIHTNPDILVLDENLTVGDKEFRVKSFKKIQEFMGFGKTIIVASHEMWLIRELCSKVIQLDNGKIAKFGKTENMIKNY